MAEPAIRARQLSRRFGGFTAVDGVSFDVQPGEIFCYLGANGAGKSTTIRMLCGLLTPSSGFARVAGYDVALAAAGVKGAIGYMSQRFSLYSELTVAENLELFAGVYGLGRRAARARIEEVLKVMGLVDDRRRVTGALPGGRRQRAALGCALVHEPRILFLDEPTAGVDPIARRSFWDLLRELSARGTTLFVTTHHLDEAEYCHRVGFMVAGRLTAMDTPEALKRRFVSGRLFEVEGGGPEEISAVRGVVRVEAFGAVHHVTALPGLADRALRSLRELGEVREIEPTLEDVFLAVAQPEPS